MLDALLATLLDTAAGWPPAPVLAVAAVVLLVESGSMVGILLPGATLLVGLGLWAQVDPTRLVPAVAAAAAGTVAGAHVGWWRARTGPLLAGRAAAARLWLAGRGPLATAALLAAGHWAAAVRPVLPRVAGGAGVGYRVVGPALILSGTAWAATLVLLGNAVGPLVLTHAGWVPVVLVALLVGGLLRQRREPLAEVVADAEHDGFDANVETGIGHVLDGIATRPAP